MSLSVLSILLFILSLVPDRSTPAATWQSFIAAVRSGDKEGIELCWTAEDREVMLEYDLDFPENYLNTVLAEEIYGDVARVLVGRPSIDTARRAHPVSAETLIPEDFAVWMSLVKRRNSWLLTWDDRDVLRHVTRNWRTKTTRHFIYHYRDFHPSEELMEANEKHLQRVASILWVQVSRKVECFLVGSERDVRLLRGHETCSDCAGPGYIISGPGSLLHEINHIVAAELGHCALQFFDEGLAIYLESDEHTMRGISVDILARDELNKGICKSASDLMQPKMFNAAKLHGSHGYASAASFVKYIIENYGMDRLKQLYRQINIENRYRIFREVYGKSLAEIDETWQKYLRSLRLTPTRG